MVGALFIFAIALGAYAWTTSPACGWLDSAEFVAASASLGIPHPPGHPLVAVLGRAAMLIPFGDVPFRVNLSSAVAMAMAVALVYVVGRELLAQVARALTRVSRAFLAMGVALGFGATFSAWHQAVRAEVYALTAALLVTALVFVRRYVAFRDPRALASAGLSCGLALANHHFVAVLFLLPAAAIALSARPSARAAFRTALLGMLGLLAFLYLPARAARDPMVNWGDPDTPSRFAWTVSAQAFQKSLSSERHDTRAGDAIQVAGVLLEQASPWFGLLALAGAYLLLRRRRTRGDGLLLAGVLASVSIGPALVGFDPDNPDAHGYLLPALAALFLLAAAGIGIFADGVLARVPKARAPAQWGLGLLGLLIPSALAGTHATQASMRNALAADQHARMWFDALPPRTLLVTSYFETLFEAWALAAVERYRPDVTHVDRGLLSYPGSKEALARREPSLAPLVNAPFTPGAPTPIPLLAQVAAHRPVAFELHFNLDEPLLPHLVPDGLVAWFTASPPSDTTRAQREAADATHADELRFLLSSPAPRDRVGALRLLLWNAFQRARFYCLLRRLEAARTVLGQAHRLAPDDPAIATLEEECGLGAGIRAPARALLP